MLFITITIICLILTFTTDIVKALKISKLFAPKVNEVPRELQDAIRRAREDLENVKKSGPGSGEYAYFIKTMRAEQKLKDLEHRALSERSMGHALKGASLDLILNYGVKVFLYLTLIVISIMNRYNPVLIFDQQFNLQPLQGLLSFPTGVPNAVSVPIWVLSCNVTFRMISSFIKQK